MIGPDQRFFAPSGDIYPGGPRTWNIVDWDQRRQVSVTMGEELESEDLACQHLLKYIDHLDPSVYEIQVSSEGDLISTSTNPDDDMTRSVFYAPLETLQRPDTVQIVSRADLEEIDRIAANIDLVVYPPSSEQSKKVIFKYYFLFQRLSFVWHEMNLWMRLPQHPNIVPFDRVVVDELEGRTVGFTTIYIPGGTVQDNTSRIFKLKWLRQLTMVIDELNLNVGIAHQDIAPRNLLINEETDDLMIFDFNYSARIGEPGFTEARNDIKGVIFTMYEIVTRNRCLRDVRHEEQDASRIENAEWVKHPDVVLDQPVSEFRAVLREWSDTRRAGKQMSTYTDAPNYIDWPDLPDPPLTEFEFGVQRAKEMRKVYDWRRTNLLEKGQTVLNWQRPPQRMM